MYIYKLYIQYTKLQSNLYKITVGMLKERPK